MLTVLHCGINKMTCNFKLSAHAHKVNNLVLVLMRSENGFVLVLIGVKIYLVQGPIWKILDQ